jgi:hypothetical protein
MATEITKRLCNNCICLPVCISKSINMIVIDCVLMRYEILDVASYARYNSYKIRVTFLGLNKNIYLEIYSDTVYILQFPGANAIASISRKKTKKRGSLNYV